MLLQTKEDPTFCAETPFANRLVDDDIFVDYTMDQFYLTKISKDHYQGTPLAKVVKIKDNQVFLDDVGFLLSNSEGYPRWFAVKREVLLMYDSKGLGWFCFWVLMKLQSQLM